MPEFSNIKVLYVIDTLEGYGAEKSLVEIAKNFKKVVPVFVHIYEGAMLKPILENEGIKVYSINLRKKYGFTEAVKLLEKIFLKERPEIIHATLYRSEIITRKLKIKYPEIKLIGSLVSNAYSKNRYYGKSYIAKLKLQYFHILERKTARLVDLFISNSYTIKHVTGKAVRIPEDKIRVIFRGRNKDNYLSSINRTQKSRNEDFILLNVSRLIPLKGQLDLIRALPEVAKKYKFSLFIAGDGFFRSRLEQEVKRLHLKDYVNFIGRTDKVRQHLKKTDIFIYPSYSEGLPGALIEAMMAGNIIIASNIPENLECVNEDSAVIFKKGNVQELSKSIIKVLEDINAYKNLGENAQRIAFEKFDVKKIARQYEQVYQSI